MELGDFKIPGYEEYEKAPQPGQAIVLVPEKDPPPPNTNTIEGMIAGVGLMASAGARRDHRSRLARWLTLTLLVVFVAPAVISAIGMLFL